MHRLLILELVLLVFITVQDVDAVQRDRPNFCPTDYLRIQNKCYYFSSYAETWQASYWKCAELNSTLAVLLNRHQSDALRTFLSKGYLAHVDRWLGGRYDWKKMQWKWATNGKVIYFHQFLLNRTDDKSYLKWHCLLIDPRINYRWDSSSCLEKKYYICETKLQKPRANQNQMNISISPPRLNRQDITPSNVKNGTHHLNDSQPGYYIINADSPTLRPRKKKKHKKFICPSNFYLARQKCYLFSPDKATWQNAFYKCQDLGSELAILKNMKQDKRLRTSVKKYNISKEQRWLGGRYDWHNLTWKWATSGHVVQQQMHLSEHLRWACIVWDPKLLNKWTSESCLETKHYICQTNAKRLKRMRTRDVTYRPVHVEMEFRINNVTQKRVSN